MVLSILFACQQMPATGNPLAPAPVAQKAAPKPAGTAPKAQPSSEGGFDFDADAKEIENTELPDDPIAILAAQQGLEVPQTPAMDAPPAYDEPPQQELALPAAFAPDTSVDWGLRLVSTVHNVEPPRAILGLPDGTETIVTAGAMLPEINAVVMAVGRQQIDVAYISPAGYQARVETRRITALFPE